jgi:glycerol-3-phosphate O-acyltransferase|tara:strand:- start:52 stop:1485 length:1434 start_codon:yes stop_codon:yes gene_type:complete
MTGTVVIPTWLFALLGVTFVLVLINKLLIPSFRWFFRKKLNKAINELNQRLNIKLRPFQLTKRQVLLDRLVHDSQVLEHVQQFSLDDEVPREVMMEKVQQYAREIVPSFNAYIYYRLGFWLAKKLARLLYRVRVNADQSEKLKNVTDDATVVFVMNHRSNMDYILVSFLVAEKMALSYAVGEWARVWPLQGLIKSMGAYFVRRNSRNPLYRKVLERYIDMATREGVCQAVFPEGGLSRDGNLRPPKLGFLDYMLRNYDYRRDRDVIFIPVGINYDRVLEDRTLLLSMDPKAEKKSRWFAIKTTLGFIFNNLRLARKHRWNRFGFASVNFSESFSIKAYCEKRNLNFESLDTDTRFEKIEVLAQNLMHSVEKAIPAVPLAIISSVLIKNTEKRVDDGLLSLEKLKTDAHQLMEKMESNGGKLVFPHKDNDWVLQTAIERLALRRLIKIKNEQVELMPNQKNVISYYANSIKIWGQQSF